MAWTETAASSWGELDIKIGTPGTDNVMSLTLASIGNVKEESFSVETEDGKKLQWFASGHNLIDEMQLQPTLTIKLEVKNLNLVNLAKFWDVTDGVDGIAVNSMASTSKYSVSIAPLVVGAESLLIPYCAVAMKPTYSEDSGWGQEVTFTILSPAADAALFTIGQVV